MRLIPLHNALLTLSKLLHAEAAAIKLIPHPGAAWLPVDVAVGETYELQRMDWREGAPPPELQGGVEQSVFGIPGAYAYRVDSDCLAWRIDVTDELLSAMPGQFKFAEKRGADRDSLGSLWIGLILDADSPVLQVDIAATTSNEITELLLGVGTQALWGLYQSIQTHSDPLTGLPSAAEFRSRLQRAVRQLREKEQGVALLLVGIDDYMQVRRQFGHQRAQRLVGDVTPLLEGAIRKQDDLCRYREAHFAVIAQVKDEQACEHVAAKLMSAFNEVTALTAYPDVSASIGYVYCAGGDEARDTDLQALCMSAEQALARAGADGGGRIMPFSGSFDSDQYNLGNALGSVMSDPAREHRNSQILWRTVSLIAAESATDVLCQSFADLIEVSLDAHSVTLLHLAGDELRLLADASAPLATLINAQQQTFVRQSLEHRRTQVHEDAVLNSYWLATPLISRGCAYGCLFVNSKIALDAADRVFFKALADQLAGALDRAELARGEIAASQEETQALRAQLTDLQQKLQVQKVPQVADSDAMRHVLDFVGRIAPTDVSVLIMGESGAGKEVMARTIHEASARNDAQMVTVDCSAITHSLIDSELFGRVRGAFTGADEASIGRIAQAEGGTLFLDEIGELPLDVQSKLLRFVQEKEIVAVGGTKPQLIDARIICATNRDLAEEVAQGRFRADLYYRLQVIQVVVPSLRERAADLPQLVQHFLHRFSVQFDRELEGLSDAAWQKARQYEWPGNVRELQNTLLRAALTAQGPVIEVDDLQLSSELPLLEGAVNNTLSPPDTVFDEHDSWQMLGAILKEQVQALIEEQLSDAPVGRWLNDAVVLAALEFTGDVVRSAAQILGIPDTTLRRQLAKAQQNKGNPLHVTGTTWLSTLPALNRVLRKIMSSERVQECLADRIERVLLEVVTDAVGDDHASGAALVGITAPTYKRRLTKYHITPGAAHMAVGYR